MNDLTAEELEQLRKAYDALGGDDTWFSNGYGAVQSKARGKRYDEDAKKWNELGLSDETREELYQSEPTVCRVPAHHGDTATGVHAAVLDFIPLAHNLMPKILAAAAERDKLRELLRFAAPHVEQLDDLLLLSEIHEALHERPE